MFADHRAASEEYDARRRAPTLAERSVWTGHPARIVTSYALADCGVHYWSPLYLVAWTMLCFGRRYRAYAAAFAWRSTTGAALYDKQIENLFAELYAHACRLAAAAGAARCTMPTSSMQASMRGALLELRRAGVYVVQRPCCVPERRRADTVVVYTLCAAAVADGSAFEGRASALP